MKTPVLIAIAVLIAACDGTESAPGAPPAANSSAAPSAAATKAPPPTAFQLEEETDLYTLDYSYPAEIAAIEPLVAFFRKDIDQIRTQLAKAARADRNIRRKQGADFNPYNSTTAYEVAGKSARLLTVEKAHSEYTGGAHPNHYTAALLWDYGAGREIRFGDLFVSPANRDRLLLQRWCDAINVEREKRRGEPITASDDMFDQCPPLDDLAIIPADKDGNGRFERLRIVASPYVAGPYSEGDYEVELAVTPDLVTALKQAYQPGFEVGQLTQ